MSEWREYKLSDIAEITTGFPFKGNKYTSTGIKVVRGENVTIGDLRWDSIKCWDEDFDQFDKYSLKKGDVVIGMDGSRVGKNRAQIRETDLPLLLAQRVACVRAKIGYSQDLIAYLIKSNRFERYVEMVHTGTSIPHISQKQIEEFTITIPQSLSTQTAIAEILSSIDDKIELNNKINQELETLAQTLFKQWFIDFEFPNENGEPYKSSGGEMIDSELGEIPKGFEVVYLSDLFDFLEGPGLRNWQYRLEGMPFINIRLIQDGDIRKNNISYISIDEFENKYTHFALNEGDVVLSTSGTLGKSAIIRKNHLPLMLNTSVIRFRPFDLCYLSFMYQYLQSKTFIDEVKASATGSVQLNFGPVHLKKIKLIKSNIELAKQFELALSPIYKQIQHLRSENDELANTRDTLLPKLISGELEINEISN